MSLRDGTQSCHYRPGGRCSSIPGPNVNRCYRAMCRALTRVERHSPTLVRAEEEPRPEFRALQDSAIEPDRFARVRIQNAAAEKALCFAENDFRFGIARNNSAPDIQGKCIGDGGIEVATRQHEGPATETHDDICL